MINGNQLWIFKDISDSYSDSSFETLTRTWILNRHESGLFATRHSFTRKKAVKWSYIKDERYNCSYYQPTTEGYLDVGLLSEDFYIMPEYIHRVTDMVDFIDRYRPRLNSCEKTPFNMPLNTKTTIYNNDKSIMHFYPMGDLQ